MAVLYTSYPSRKQSYIVAFAFILLTLPSSASAQEASGWQSGEDVYGKVCRYCHETGVGPAIRGQHLPVESIMPIVRHGFLAMPAFSEFFIDNKSLEAVAKYVSQSPAPTKN